MADSDLATYAVVIDGLCVNIIVWDGVTGYDPGDDVQLVKLEDGDGGIGWAYHAASGEWTDVRPEPELEQAD